MTHRRSGVPRRLAAAAVLAAAALAAPLALWPAASRAQVAPEETLKSFTVADGLEAAVWATEPMLVNPTNIDVDARGRVWVAEGANYRGSVTRPEGDRIVILEDTDNDGKADSTKVFTQDPSLMSPLGITVLGNKVYVAQSPSMLVYTIDESGDKPTGKPEVMFTGFSGVNHDHGLHAIQFGPDGRFYFNAGNDGCGVREPFKHGDGKPVVDSLGSEVPRGKQWRGGERKPGTLGYVQGMAFRCNPDGSGFETLGFNFRNNYEVAPDSFGTAWQSDNDDDGNEGVRINYVMEGGNFGYAGPKGHDWARDQAAFPDQTKQQAHWHQKWPGVVPNLLHTGGGSPTGILVYEGDLLPERFRGALIHCDPGPNIVRAYVPTRSAQVPVKKFNEENSLQGPDKDGAGYRAEVIDIVKGADAWFRPSDVCVAPDGSLFIADWYDPGVGGHATGDKPSDNQGLRGRIYRVAPKGHQPATPKVDLASSEGQIAALKSPNLATRYLAYTKLRDAGDAAVGALRNTFDSDPNPRFRARALWLLARTGSGQEAVAKALKDPDVDIRITGLRAARLIGMDAAAIAKDMLSDTSPAVLREIALAMNYQPADKAVPILVELANRYDGEDRWYLEAIGIGATGKEEALLAAWEKDGKNKDEKAGEMLRWRLKMEMPAQARLDDKIQVVGEWWAAGPFDGGPEGAAGGPLGTDFGPDAAPAAINTHAPLKGAGGKPAKWERVEAEPYDGALAGLRWVDFVGFCEKRNAPAMHVVGYFAANVVSPVEQPAKLVLGSNDGCRLWVNGVEVLNHDVGRSLRWGDDTVHVDLKQGSNVLLAKLHQREGKAGLIVTVEAAKQKVAFSENLPAPDQFAAAAGSPDASSSSSAPGQPGEEVLKTKDGEPLPAFAELAKLAGDPKAGEAVFADAKGANCVACHQVGTKGQMLGPPLTTIGQKLSKAQLYEAILKPSAGILMGFENWVVRTSKGTTVSGLKTSDTFDGITIKDTQGKYHDIAADEIKKLVKQPVSIMPEGLSGTMTRQELVDLVEYLSTLRNK